MNLRIRGEHTLYEMSKLNKKADIEKRRTDLLDSLKDYSSCLGNEWDLEETIHRALSGETLFKLKLNVSQ